MALEQAQIPYSETKEYKKTQSQRYRERKMLKGLCVACGCNNKPDEQHVLCLPCREDMSARSRKRIAERKAKGQCIQCGSTELVTRVHCERCRISNLSRGLRANVGPARRVIKRYREVQLAAVKKEQRNLRRIALEALEGPDWIDLPPRVKTMVERRYGLKTGIPETLLEIGDAYGMTRERVRQLTYEFHTLVAQPLKLSRLIHDETSLKRAARILRGVRPPPITVKGRPVSETLLEDRR